MTITESSALPAWARQASANLGAEKMLPCLIDQFAEACDERERLDNAYAGYQKVWRAQDDVIDLRRMTTFRLQQMEMLEFSTAKNRAHIFWSTISRMWVCEVEPVQ